MSDVADQQDGSWEDEWETAEPIALPPPLTGQSASSTLPANFRGIETDKVSYVPQVKLLKRDTNTPTSGQKMERTPSGSSQKSQADREAEYAAARARIFAEGAGGKAKDVVNKSSSGRQATSNGKGGSGGAPAAAGRASGRLPATGPRREQGKAEGRPGSGKSSGSQQQGNNGQPSSRETAKDGKPEQVPTPSERASKGAF
ncbi:uncharacterized protein EV422DRAFT_249955 [Fimicolochytrium jonesii]|uniref:uncharacterized protein n=1 Tax=Fimicolochytrium jonesii TaxID=1396493 RepID=UPI0022FE8254|nr:uncharacterized protein EV422DRAFT_249955 [Fimicolochytrium jonesii]KAI8825212.1 hypothetical protein EV422DRAFT_249955 [Fimicolochytrium jonesii]